MNIDDLYISQPDSGEQALEIADSLVRSGAMDMIVASRSGKDNWEIEEDAKKVSVKGKWWKIGAAAAAGSLIVFAGHFSLLYLSLAPVLLPAAAALLQTLTGMAAVIGGSTAITTAIVSALSATSAFLASSAGLTVFSAGLLAGGAGYAGYE